MQKSTLFKAVIWIGMLLFARLMPHLPNFSPYASLVLLLGCQLSKREVLLLTLVSLVLSDMTLAVIFGYGVFGLWSVFTYTGFLAMAFGSAVCLNEKHTLTRIGFYAVGSVFGYWLWTNFGTWLTTSLYAHSATGWMACLVAGLPFLQNSLLAAMVFVPVCFGLIVFLEKKEVLRGF